MSMVHAPGHPGLRPGKPAPDKVLWINFPSSLQRKPHEEVQRATFRRVFRRSCFFSPGRPSPNTASFTWGNPPGAHQSVPDGGVERDMLRVRLAGEWDGGLWLDLRSWRVRHLRGNHANEGGHRF